MLTPEAWDASEVVERSLGNAAFGSMLWRRQEYVAERSSSKALNRVMIKLCRRREYRGVSLGSILLGRAGGLSGSAP